MRILVTGDRHWTDRQAIRDALKTYPAGTTLIHGDCSGADRMAADVAREMWFTVHGYPADRLAHGLAAGPRRNVRMLTEGRPDVVIAFHPDLAKSKGTAHMVKIAKAAGVPVIHIH